MGVVTLLTVQNTKRLSKVVVLNPKLILAQLDAILEDLPCHAAKTGALGNAGVVSAIAKRAVRFPFPLVVDPVMVSKKGRRLLDREACQILKKRLLPHATLVTPNLEEAEYLSGMEVTHIGSMEKAARKISLLGPEAVLVKGGDLKGEATDLLYHRGTIHLFSAPRLKTRHTHGTGCVYSAAIAAELAQGKELLKAIRAAKEFVTAAIRTHPALGHGEGPLNLHATLDG